MEKASKWTSSIMQQQVVALLMALAVMAGVQDVIDIENTVVTIFAAVNAIIAIGTAIARLRNANPPLTDAAAAKVAELQK